MERRTDVAVDAEGDCDCRMAEAFLDNPRVDALFEGEGRPRMAEAVECQAGESGASDLGVSSAC